MSEIQQFTFIQKTKNESVRKRLGIQALYFNSPDVDENTALMRMALAFNDAGYAKEDFKKAIRINYPVVGDVPADRVLDTTFCDRYQLGGEDGKTMMPIPGAAAATEGTDRTIVDGVDTETGEIVDQQRADEAMHDRAFTYRQYSWEKRIYATLRFGLFDELTPEQLKEISAMAMDQVSTYEETVKRACQSDKLRQLEQVFPETLNDLFTAMYSIWPAEGKSPSLTDLISFFSQWINTHTNDRTSRDDVTEKWKTKFNKQIVNRTPSGANAGGGNKTDRLTPLTPLGLEYEISLGLIARREEFDIYNPRLAVDAEANAILNLKRNKDDDVMDEFLATKALFENMPGGMDYSRACIIATVKTTPEGKYKEPDKHLEYLNRVLIETDHAHPDELLVDIACGRSSSPMPMRMTEEPSREDVDKALAAGRGEFVEGVSDPEDPKWVNEDLTKTTSNADEKTEVETADDVQIQESDTDEEPAGDEVHSGKSGVDAGEEADTVEDFGVNQNTENDNQNGDSVNQNEPDVQETEPEVQQPEPVTGEPGIYFDISNEAYHAGSGVSKSQLDDIASCPAIFQWRKTAPIDTEKTKSLDMGTALHCLLLEPDEFADRFIIAPEFNRRSNAGKEEEKAFLEDCADSGKTVMTAKEGRKLELMRESAMAHPVARWLLEEDGHCESSIYWKDHESGLLCRCRPDKIITKFNWVADVKTTGDIRQFKTSYYDYRYHVQDAFYSDGYEAQFGEQPIFVFLVVSTAIECGRYPVDIFMMGEDAKQAGRNEYHRNLQTLSGCLSTDEWPGINTLNLPRWAKENANV